MAPAGISNTDVPTQASLVSTLAPAEISNTDVPTQASFVSTSAPAGISNTDIPTAADNSTVPVQPSINNPTTVPTAANSAAATKKENIFIRIWHIFFPERKNKSEITPTAASVNEAQVSSTSEQSISSTAATSINENASSTSTLESNQSAKGTPEAEKVQITSAGSIITVENNLSGNGEKSISTISIQNNETPTPEPKRNIFQIIWNFFFPQPAPTATPTFVPSPMSKAETITITNEVNNESTPQVLSEEGKVSTEDQSKTVKNITATVTSEYIENDNPLWIPDEDLTVTASNGIIQPSITKTATSENATMAVTAISTSTISSSITRIAVKTVTPHATGEISTQYPTRISPTKNQSVQPSQTSGALPETGGTLGNNIPLMILGFIILLAIILAARVLRKRNI